MQGCSIQCPGCVNRDTWKRNAGHQIEIGRLIGSCHHWFGLADGVTISGGEPFDQPAALSILIAEIRKVNQGDILVYSGFPHKKLFKKHASILSNVDVLVSEPYKAKLENTLVLRGSDNQRVFLLTELARKMYPADIDQRKWAAHRNLDVFVGGEGAWMVGIPKSGDMARFRNKFKASGYSCVTSDQKEIFIRA